MSLKARIVTGVILAVVVPLVVGTTAVMNMRRMAAGDQDLFYDGTVPLTTLSQVTALFLRMRIASRDLLEAEGKPAAANYDRQLDELSGEIDKLLGAYANTPLIPEEKIALQQFEETRKSYLDNVAQLRTLSKTNRRQDGWRILHSEPYNLVVASHLAAIDKLVSIEVEEAKQHLEINAGLARSSMLEVLAAMFLAIVCSVGGGLWLDHLLSKNTRVQEALQASEERFRLVSRATNDGIWDWDLVTGKGWWNENLQTTFGYAPNEIEPGVEGWKSHIHPDDRERVVQSITRAIEGGQVSWVDEYRFLRRDGSYADVLDRGHVSRNADGRPLRMVGAMTDITQRKRAELQYRTLFENINDAAFVTSISQDGMPARFKQVNDVACRRLGYSRAELLQLSPEDIDAPEFLSQRASVMARLAAGEPVLFETLQVAKDGHRISVELSARRFNFEGEPAVLAIARDITERKRVEAALRESEEQFRQLAENIHEVFFIVAAEPPRMIYTSPAYQQVWGRSRDELYERANAWTDSVHPEDRENAVEVFRRCLTGAPVESEFRVIRPDGELR